MALIAYRRFLGSAACTALASDPGIHTTSTSGQMVMAVGSPAQAMLRRPVSPVAEPGCCEATRLDEAGAWMTTVEDLQAEVARLRVADSRRLAMLALHCGYAEGSQPMQCVSGCGAWPCTTYLACYPESAWTEGEST